MVRGGALKGYKLKGRKASPKRRFCICPLIFAHSVLFLQRKFFVSQKRTSGFPEKRADLRGSPGTSGEVRGASGEVWETSGEPLDCYSVPHQEDFPGSRRKLPGKFGGTSGEVRGLSRSSGEPDSLPVTRQICLQFLSKLGRDNFL